MKYTKEKLEPLVKESTTMVEVLRKLGLAINSGGTHHWVSRRIREFGINTSHFKRPATNYGLTHKGGVRRRSSDEILVLKTNGYGEKTRVLKRALLNIGREYKCECGQEPEWKGKPLVLQIEHKNGNHLDDRQENLTFLCPNCHTQTSTYGRIKAGMAEFADAPDLESGAARREGSIPSSRTMVM